MESFCISLNTLHLLKIAYIEQMYILPNNQIHSFRHSEFSQIFFIPFSKQGRESKGQWVRIKHLHNPHRLPHRCPRVPLTNQSSMSFNISASIWSYIWSKLCPTFSPPTESSRNSLTLVSSLKPPGKTPPGCSASCETFPTGLRWLLSWKKFLLSMDTQIEPIFLVAKSRPDLQSPTRCHTFFASPFRKYG